MHRMKGVPKLFSAPSRRTQEQCYHKAAEKSYYFSLQAAGKWGPVCTLLCPTQTSFIASLNQNKRNVLWCLFKSSLGFLMCALAKKETHTAFHIFSSDKINICIRKKEKLKSHWDISKRLPEMAPEKSYNMGRKEPARFANLISKWVANQPKGTFFSIQACTCTCRGSILELPRS